MVELVADDGIICSQECFEEASIGIKARGIEYGCISSKKLRKALFKLLVDHLCATDKAHRRKAKTPTIVAVLGSVNNFWVVCKAQIVVATEVENLFFLSKTNVRRLR